MLSLPCCSALVLIASSAAYGQPLQEWSWASPDAAAPDHHGCELRVEDGRLVGEATGDSYYFWLPVDEVEAPVKLVLRMKTDDRVFGRGELYWHTDRRPDVGMHNHRHYQVQHDDQWHTYEIPLPATGTLTGLRVAPGWKPGSFAVEWARLEPDPYPQQVIDSQAKLPERLEVENERLALVVETSPHRYTVTDKEAGRTYVGDASALPALLTSARKTAGDDIELEFYEHAARTRYAGTIAFNDEAALAFELTPADPEAAFMGVNQWPPKLTTATERGRLIFNDRSAGTFIPQGDETYGGTMLGVYGNTQCTDLPLMALVDMTTGDGFIALAETPVDAMFHVAPDDAGKHWPQIHWRESMDAARYARRLSYRFTAGGGYVDLARLYRNYARDSGRYVPFSEKLERKPNVALLQGAPIIWGGIDAWDWTREARTEGMRRGVISNAHHGLNDQGALRRLQEMGYVTCPYDSFGDALDGPTGFNQDDMEETAVHLRPGLGPAQGWVDELNTYFTRSSAFALRALKTYVRDSLEEFGFNGRFIDVSMAIHLMEDWHPQHTFDRRQDLANRREAFQWLDDFGLVLGVEHGNDWGAEFIEYGEGSLGGPMWWRASEGDWSAGHLTRAESRDDYPEVYLKYGNRYDLRIPFWQLVYHDANVSTSYWGDGPGFHYHADPNIAARKDLFALLYGGVPILWRGPRGYDWSRNAERFMQSYFDSCLFHEEAGFARMTDHEFITDDMSVQRTAFDSGHTALVNFRDAPYVHMTADGDEVTLAPQGFLVEGPGFRQSLLIEDGAVIKRIEKGDFLLYETPEARTLGPVSMSGGRFVAFETEPGSTWQLGLKAGHRYGFRVSDATGWPVAAPYALLELDKYGTPRRFLQAGASNDEIALRPDESARFYALSADFEPGTVVMYPESPWVEEDAPILLTTAGREAVVRYTTDGSAPTADAPIAEGQVLLDRGARVMAQAFIGRHPAGPAVTRDYRVVKELFATGVMKGGDEAVQVDVSLDGFAQLRLLVGNAGDHCWSDWADFGDAAFVTESGEKVYLSDLHPDWSIQTYEEMGRDKNPNDGTPLAISGQSFEKGLACFSEADIAFPVRPGYDRFVAWVGVDDRANPPEGGPEALRGTVTFTVQGVRPGQPKRIELTPVDASDPIAPAKSLAEGEGQALTPIAFEMQAPWMTGPVMLRIPEVLNSSLGLHFIDHAIGGRSDLIPLNPWTDYPEWRQDKRTGELAYDTLTPEGLEFGCTARPGADYVDVEFRVTNRAKQPVSFVSGNMCLHLGGAPEFNLPWELDKLFIAYDGALRPLSATTPTPVEKGTAYPWLHFLSSKGLATYEGPRDLGHSWFVDQVAGPENLMAAESKDGKRLIGYTWDDAPGVLMSNCGNPCLHTGTDASPVLEAGESHRWRGKVYFTSNDRPALLERVRRDRRSWAEE